MHFLFDNWWWIVHVLFVSLCPTAPGVAQRFSLILGGLCGVVAARMARPRTAREQAAFPLLMLLWIRLRHIAARFGSLAKRVAAGPLPDRRFRPARPARPPQSQRRLPADIGWLIRLLPEAACHGSQLHHLLCGPDMKAFLEAAPHAARLLRPLCQMLAIPTLAIPATSRPTPPGKPALGETAPPAAEAPSLPPGGGAPHGVSNRLWQPPRLLWPQKIDAPA